MKRLPSLTLALGTALAAASAHAITVEQALLQFDQKVRDYNVITFGNTTLSGGQDVEAGLAVQGNLTLNGGWSIGSHPSEFDENSNPTLFVGGSLAISSGSNAKLESGYASLANIGSGWNWNGTTDTISKSGNGTLSTINSPHALADINPKSNAAPSGWNWTTLKSDMLSLSTSFNAFANNGNISVNTATQTLEFKANAGAKGPIVVDLDLNILNGTSYNGKYFSNVNFILPTNTTFIVNVLNANAAGDTIFGAGVNFNGSAYASRLLWNFVDSTPTGTPTTISIGNGGEFSGSILAASYAVTNYNGTLINGQVVAASLDLTCNELHYAGFCPPEVPEPSTYGVIGAAACLGVLVLRTRRQRAA